MTELRQLDVRIPRDLYDRIDQLAREHHQHRAEFLREKLAEIAGVDPPRLVRRDYGSERRRPNSGVVDWYGVGVTRQRTRDAIHTLKDAEP